MTIRNRSCRLKRKARSPRRARADRWRRLHSPRDFLLCGRREEFFQPGSLLGKRRDVSRSLDWLGHHDRRTRLTLPVIGMGSAHAPASGVCDLLACRRRGDGGRRRYRRGLGPVSPDAITRARRAGAAQRTSEPAQISRAMPRASSSNEPTLNSAELRRSKRYSRTNDSRLPLRSHCAT